MVKKVEIKCRRDGCSAVVPPSSSACWCSAAGFFLFRRGLWFCSWIMLFFLIFFFLFFFKQNVERYFDTLASLLCLVTFFANHINSFVEFELLIFNLIGRLRSGKNLVGSFYLNLRLFVILCQIVASAKWFRLEDPSKPGTVRGHIKNAVACYTIRSLVTEPKNLFCFVQFQILAGLFRSYVEEAKLHRMSKLKCFKRDDYLTFFRFFPAKTLFWGSSKTFGACLTKVDAICR